MGSLDKLASWWHNWRRCDQYPPCYYTHGRYSLCPSGPGGTHLVGTSVPGRRLGLIFSLGLSEVWAGMILDMTAWKLLLMLRFRNRTWKWLKV